MKKFLSVLLAVMMVLSTVSFAAPSFAGSADSAIETPVFEEAGLADEKTVTDDDGNEVTLNILAGSEFDTAEDVSYYNGVFRSATLTQETIDGVTVMKIDNSTSTKVNDVNSSNRLTTPFAPAELKEVQVRFKVEDANVDLSNVSIATYTREGSNVLTGASQKVAVTEGEWYTVTFAGSSYQTGNQGDFKDVAIDNYDTFQFGFSGQDVAFSATTVIYVDYIRLVGYPLETLNVTGSGNVADYTAKFSVATTVADVIADADASALSYTEYVKTLKTADGTVLATDAVIAEHFADGDTATLVLGYYDDFDFDFDDTTLVTSNVTIKEETVDGRDVRSLTSTGAAHRLVFQNASFPAGQLEKIYITLKTSDVTVLDGTKNLFWDYTTGIQANATSTGFASGSVAAMSSLVVDGTYANDEWFTVCLDPSAIKHTTSYENSAADQVTLQEDGFKFFRYDLGSGVNGSVIYIDDVVFVGQPLVEYTLNYGDRIETAYLSTTEAVSSLVADLATDDPTSTVKGFKYDGEYYTGDKTLEDVPEYAVLEVLYGTSLISSYEFTTDTEGVTYNRGVTNSWEDGCLVIDYSTASQLNNAHPGDTISCNIPIGGLKDIQIRVKVVGETVTMNQLSYFYIDGAVYGTSVGLSRTFTDGEWLDISFEDVTGFHTIANNTALGSNITAFRFDFSGAMTSSSTKIYIDYIRFIGEPKSTAVVNMGEDKDLLAGDFISTTTVEEFINSLGYVGTSVIAGISKTEGGEAVASTELMKDVVEDYGTVYAVLEANEYYGEYGYKVWSIDFDDAAAGEITVGTTVNASTLGFDTNPSFNTSSATKFFFTNGASAFEVVEENGNKYLKVTAGTASSSGMFYIHGQNISFSTQDGHYVFTYDALSDFEEPSRVMFNKKNVVEEMALRYDAAVPGEWSTYAGYYPKEERYYNGAMTQYIDDITEISIIKFNQQGDVVVAGSELCLDNLTLWYVPKSVDVTVVAGDNESVKDIVYTISPAGTDLSDFLASIDGGTYKAKSVSLTEGGEALTSFAAVVEDAKLYVEWEEIPLLSSGMEYNSSADLTALTSAVASRNNKTARGTVVDNTDKGYATIEYAFPHEELDGFTYNGVTYDYAMCYDTGFFLPCFTTGATFDLEDITSIVMKVRYNFPEDFAAETEEFEYAQLKYGGVGTVDPNAFYIPRTMYVWLDGEAKSFGSTFSKCGSLSELNGEWLTIVIDPAKINDGVGVLSNLRFDVDVPDGTTIDIDYIRFIGESMAAPETLASETALRNIADGVYDNAIRFKAAVGANTVEKAADLGWVVSTEAYLEANSIEELTIDNVVEGSNKVKVAYQRQASEAVVAGFFDTTNDEEWVMAAFIYNIPAANALDNVVIRPFAKAENASAVYGEAVVTNLYTYAVAPYIVIDGYDTIEEVMDDGVAYEDAEADEIITFNDAYTALETEQQDYIVEILTAILG